MLSEGLKQRANIVIGEFSILSKMNHDMKKSKNLVRRLLYSSTLCLSRPDWPIVSLLLPHKLAQTGSCRTEFGLYSKILLKTNNSQLLNMLRSKKVVFGRVQHFLKENVHL